MLFWLSASAVVVMRFYRTAIHAALVGRIGSYCDEKFAASRIFFHKLLKMLFHCIFRWLVTRTRDVSRVWKFPAAWMTTCAFGVE